MKVVKIKDPGREGKFLRYTVEDYFYNADKKTYYFTDKFGENYEYPEHMFAGIEPERTSEAGRNGNKNRND